MLLGFLLVEAGQATVRSQQEWRSKFFHLALRCGARVVTTARRRNSARTQQSPEIPMVSYPTST